MKRLIILAALVSLAGCATAQVNAGKSLALAWQGLDAAAVSADVAVKAGKLSGSNAALVAADLRKAKAALLAATNAYTASGSTADPSAEIAIAVAATSEIVSIVGVR